MSRTIFASSTPVVPSQDQLSADLAGEAVIVNLKNGVYYGLDSVGYKIWGLIQERKSVEQIHDAILEEYEVESERLERDLTVLLQRLEDEGLIKVT